MFLRALTRGTAGAGVGVGAEARVGVVGTAGCRRCRRGEGWRASLARRRCPRFDFCVRTHSIL